MTSIRLNPVAAPPKALPGAAGAPAAPAQGKLQGRDVQVRPHAQGIVPPPSKQTASPPKLSLEQLLARAADSSPALVRQARHGAFPSVTQLNLPGANAARYVHLQAQGLPSIGELVASAGPAKSDSLLQRFLNLFRSENPPDPYKDVLNELESYHGSCHVGSVTDALYRLGALTTTVNAYLQSGDGNQLRSGHIHNLHSQLAEERTLLTNLQTELESTPWPGKCILEDLLSFAREGVSVRETARLMDLGLELEAPQTAQTRWQEFDRSGANDNLFFGYKRILADLEHYHAACTTNFTDTDPSDQVPAAHLAMTLLNELADRLDFYLRRYDHHTQANNPHTLALKDLRSQLLIEAMVLDDVLNELGEDGILPEGADLSHALAFAREGVSLKDMARLMDKGLLPSQATEARMLLDSERSTALMQALDSLAPEQRAEVTSKYSETEILLLANSGLGVEGGAEYRRLGLPITSETVAIEYNDGQRLSPMERLGKGAFNTVYETRYSGPDGIAEAIFKPLSNTESGWVAAKIGIDLRHPQIANRNLATQDVARALGFDVVVECHIGSREEPGTRQLQLGLVMERAPGRTAHAASSELFSNPEVRREITKLQLLDHLVGQGDRHAGNYFIHTYVDESGQTRAKVSGIDNDQCFGKNTLRGDDIAHAPNPGRHGYRGTRMPELVDTDMAAAIRSLTPERLSSMLSGKLSDQEVEAATMRLEHMLLHLRDLEWKDQIITPEAWNAGDLRQVLTPGNSYVGRDGRSSGIFF